jgi:hypothetical protein
MPDDTIYVPAAGRRIPMPGNRGDWPADGRPVNRQSVYELRLVKDGDLVPAKSTGAKKSAGDNGGDK